MLGRNETDVVRAVHETLERNWRARDISNICAKVPTTPVGSNVAFVKAGQNYRPGTAPDDVEFSEDDEEELEEEQNG